MEVRGSSADSNSVRLLQRGLWNETLSAVTDKRMQLPQQGWHPGLWWVQLLL